MPKPRSSGRSTSIRRSSSQMLPPESGSSPATQLSAVDLPQPEGPSRATNSPRRIVSVSSSSAVVSWKRRVTRSSFSSSKPPSRTAPASLTARPGAPFTRSALLLDLGPADLLVPFAEGRDQVLAEERRHDRVLRHQLVVFGPAELLEQVLALLGGERDRHVLHRRTRIEISRVVGDSLLLGLQHEGDQVQHDR